MLCVIVFVLSLPFSGRSYTFVAAWWSFTSKAFICQHTYWNTILRSCVWYCSLLKGHVIRTEMSLCAIKQKYITGQLCILVWFMKIFINFLLQHVFSKYVNASQNFNKQSIVLNKGYILFWLCQIHKPSWTHPSCKIFVKMFYMIIKEESYEFKVVLIVNDYNGLIKMLPSGYISGPLCWHGYTMMN